jgi:hypothetical protein
LSCFFHLSVDLALDKLTVHTKNLITFWETTSFKPQAQIPSASPMFSHSLTGSASIDMINTQSSYIHVRLMVFQPDGLEIRLEVNRKVLYFPMT